MATSTNYLDGMLRQILAKHKSANPDTVLQALQRAEQQKGQQGAAATARAAQTAQRSAATIDRVNQSGQEQAAMLRAFQEAQAKREQRIAEAEAAAAEQEGTESAQPAKSTASNTAKQAEETTNPDLSATLERLLADYNNAGYTPKTQDEIRRQAETEFSNQYDQLRLAAQQQQEQSDLALQRELEKNLLALQQQGDTSDLALQQQRAGLQDTYDRQREDSAKQYRQTYSQADRQMLGRGMQRSSYAAQTLANIGQKGAEAQQRLWDEQGTAEGNIDAQRAQLAEQIAAQKANLSQQTEAQRSQLARQLSAQLSQYDASQASDVLKRTQELQDQEYDRGVQQQQLRSQLGSNLYNLLYQAERDKIKDDQLERELKLKYANTTGTSSSYSGGSSYGGSYSGGSGGASTGSSAGNSGFNQREYENSLALIKAGALNANKSPLNGNGGTNTGPRSTSDLFAFLDAPGSGAAAQGSSTKPVLSTNVTTSPAAIAPKTNETVQLSGPVSNAFLNGLNTAGAKDNKTFESELQNALKNKKK